MKVKELIEHLQLLDPEMRVVVDGYECGYDEVHCTQIKNVISNPKHSSWEGEFRDYQENAETVVLLPRKS